MSMQTLEDEEIVKHVLPESLHAEILEKCESLFGANPDYFVTVGADCHLYIGLYTTNEETGEMTEHTLASTSGRSAPRWREEDTDELKPSDLKAAQVSTSSVNALRKWLASKNFKPYQPAPPDRTGWAPNSRRDALIDAVYAAGFRGDHCDPPVLVSVDQFFDGNDVVGSILPHSNPPHDNRALWKFLNSLRAREDVQEVLISIYDISNQQWPSANHIYIMTKASDDQLEEWNNTLQGEGWDEVQPSRFPMGVGYPKIRKGFRFLVHLWD